MSFKLNKFVIAVDGPAASGKGTLAKNLAKYFKIPHLDTGRLYRAVGYKLLKENKDPNDINAAIECAAHLNKNDINNKNLYCEGIGGAASIISTYYEVRQLLKEYQTNFSDNPKGAVLDGRDIGTIICPNADIKFFITADLKARARRRYKQLQNSNKTIIYDSVLDDLRKRDARDSKRMNAPLKQAEDAFHIDTTNMNASEVFEKALFYIKQKLPKIFFN